MAAIFTRRANFISRLAGAGGIFLVLVGTVVAYAYDHSTYDNGQLLFVDQPVPFSHQHHVGGLGIDCRYCHTGVEKSAYAGLPPTSTCMNCHQQLWTNADLLEPVRRSWHEDKPIEWNRVHDLPDYVYFNHSIHVNKGVGCVECHGRMDQMPLMYQAKSLYMTWCLDCHRNPAPNLRPPDQITSTTWQPPTDTAEREELAGHLFKKYGIEMKGMTDCSTCHR